MPIHRVPCYRSSLLLQSTMHVSTRPAEAPKAATGKSLACYPVSGWLGVVWSSIGPGVGQVAWQRAGTLKAQRYHLRLLILYG